MSLLAQKSQLMAQRASTCVPRLPATSFSLRSAALPISQVQQSNSSTSSRRSVLARSAGTESKVGKATPVKVEDGPAIMDDIDCVVFDCDGGWWWGGDGRG